MQKLLEARDKFKQYNQKIANRKNLWDVAYHIIEEIKNTNLSKIPEMMSISQYKDQKKDEL